MRGKFAVSIFALFVLTFSSCLVVFGAEGPLTWSQTYGGTETDTAYALVAASDGGYALAGSTRSFGAGGVDCWLVKTDASGNMEWNQKYGGTADEVAYSLVQTSDGGYALAGTIETSDDKLFLLVKTNEFGDVEWSRTYRGKRGGPNVRFVRGDTAYSLVATSDGGYALAGTTAYYGEGSSEFWLVKTDSLGNEEWNRTYGGVYTENAYSLVATSDGGYALAGRTWPEVGAGYYDFWLVKTDELGNMEWNQTYGGPETDEAYSLVETDDGGYAIAGWTASYGAGSDDVWLIKTDASGNMEWNQTYGGKGHQEARSVVETSDGGYALIGDALLFKTDAYGNMEWNRAYGGGSLDSLVETSDGVFVIAGTTSFGFGYEDFLLIKTAFPDLTAPNIIVSSPQPMTYATSSVSLAFTVDEDTQWMGYILDGQNSTTLTENTLNLTGLSDGVHYLEVYAADMEWNTGKSETICFTINTESEQPGTGPEQPDTEPEPQLDQLTLILAGALILIPIISGLGLLIHLTRKQKN